MPRYFKDILIFAALASSGFILWSVFVGFSTLDIQLHDTYFVLDLTSWVFLILGLTTFLFFLARGLVRRFSTIGTNLGLIVGLFALLLILFRFWQMLLAAVSGGMAIYIVCGLIVCLAVWTFLLILRTYRQWRQEYVANAGANKQ